MATNKNQHFVPRVHLKPFTLDSANTAIALFLLQSKTFRRNVPVKNQCSEDYFYGQDQDFEDAIQTTESEYGSVLIKIANAEELSVTDFWTLKAFWLWQNFRTRATALEIARFHNHLDAESNVPPASRKEASQRAVQQMGRQFCEAMDELGRFDCRIVVSDTNVSFVTSDHPAVLTNRIFFQTPQESHAYFGLLTPGMVGFLPLTPKRCLMVFDASIYEVQADDEQQTLSINNAADIHAINVHQYINGVSSIFPGEVFSEQAVINEFNRLKHLRVSSKVLIQPSLADSVSSIPDFVHPTDRMRDPGEWPRQIVVR